MEFSSWQHHNDTYRYRVIDDPWDIIILEDGIIVYHRHPTQKYGATECTLSHIYCATCNTEYPISPSKLICMSKMLSMGESTVKC